MNGQEEVKSGPWRGPLRRKRRREPEDSEGLQGLGRVAGQLPGELSGHEARWPASRAAGTDCRAPESSREREPTEFVRKTAGRRLNLSRRKAPTAVFESRPEPECRSDAGRLFVSERSGRHPIGESA